MDTVYGTRYSPPKTLDNDQYFWRIRATDAAGFQPDWSSRPVWRFKRAWPDQTTLARTRQNNADATSRDPFYFQWTPVKHASPYEVQLSSGDGFPTRAVHVGCTTVHTTLVYGDGLGNCWPTAPGTYYWRVTAQDEFSSAGAASPTRSSAPVGTFTYEPGAGHHDRSGQRAHFAEHLRPDVAASAAPVLTWDPVAGAEKYRVTISGTLTKTVHDGCAELRPAGPRRRDLPLGRADRRRARLGRRRARHCGQQRSSWSTPPPMIPDPDNAGQSS